MLQVSTRAIGLAALSSAVVAAVQTISKDVVIVGGGASGAYAAFRLREDYGKSIALIEREAALVGAIITCCNISN